MSHIIWEAATGSIYRDKEVLHNNIKNLNNVEDIYILYQLLVDLNKIKWSIEMNF